MPSLTHTHTYTLPLYLRDNVLTPAAEQHQPKTASNNVRFVCVSVCVGEIECDICNMMRENARKQMLCVDLCKVRFIQLTPGNNLHFRYYNHNF